MVVDLQPLESFLENRKKYGIAPRRVFPDDTDIAIGGVRKLDAAMLVFDIVDSSRYTDIHLKRDTI